MRNPWKHIRRTRERERERGRGKDQRTKKESSRQTRLLTWTKWILSFLSYTEALSLFSMSSGAGSLKKKGGRGRGAGTQGALLWMEGGGGDINNRYPLTWTFIHTSLGERKERRRSLFEKEEKKEERRNVVQNPPSTMKILLVGSLMLAASIQVESRPGRHKRQGFPPRQGSLVYTYVQDLRDKSGRFSS